MGKYLEQPVGRSSVNVFAMARDGLATPLRSALKKALARRTKVVERGVRVKKRGHAEAVDIVVLPLANDFSGSALVAFVERETASGVKVSKSGSGSASTLAELRRTKAQLESVTREMSESQDLLRGVNEDLQSANEELQSANEELTTSKEEMQSLNEELLSLNAELQSTNERLVTTNDDMRNLLNSSQIPTLFLDNELRLKRFTAPASRIARLIPADLGRPITDLTWNIAYASLAEDVAEVLRTLVFKEAEVSAPDGSFFTMRIHPYRTVDDIIDGVVMTFIDITAQKQAVARLTTAACGRLLTSVVARWPGIAYVEDIASARVDVVSAASERLLGYPPSILTGATAHFWRTLRRRPRGRKGYVELQRRDGTRTEYRERVTVLATDGAGAATSVMYTFRRSRKRAGA
jgi:two-component system CheB/CheR fusion protein